MNEYHKKGIPLPRIWYHGMEIQTGHVLHCTSTHTFVKNCVVMYGQGTAYVSLFTALH